MRKPLAHPSRPVTSVLGGGWSFPVMRQPAPENDRKLMGAAEEESVRQSILIILATAKGERVMRPDFGCGLQDLVFQVNDSTTRANAAFEVKESLQDWEPRIDVLEVRAHQAGDHGEMLLISIDYRVRSTDSRFNLVYPFYLDRPVA